MVIKCKCPECKKIQLVRIFEGTRKVAHRIKQEFRNDLLCDTCLFRQEIRKNIKRGFMK